MKSFIHFLEENIESEPIQDTHYSYSGRPHLSHVTVTDSKGNTHFCPFHSTAMINGIERLRYDFTNAMSSAEKNNAWLKLGQESAGTEQLNAHHEMTFLPDMYDKSPKGMGISIMTYTPRDIDKDDDDDSDEIPTPVPTRPASKAKQLSPALVS